MSEFSRREFLLAGAAAALAGRAALAQSPLKTPRPGRELAVSLLGRADDLKGEVVSFGVPLPPDFLSDAGRLRVLDERGEEVAATTRALEPWRLGGREGGSVRSLLVQFKFDFRTVRERRVTLLFNKSPRRRGGPLVPVRETLIDAEGLMGPRVLAVLPSEWLCDSWVVGPQTPAAESGAYADYERFVERNFPGSLKHLDSREFAAWLYDRPSNYYKMYARTGDRKFLEAGYRAAHFMRLQTETEGPNAGVFKLKGADIKYVYPRAMHLHYLLTGDERALEAGRLMARYCLAHTDPVYRPARMSPSDPNKDPEKGREFWTLRNQGYGLLGVLHGWEMTGERAYWEKARECVEAYDRHQRQPPDGRPADGSLRQNWALYDSSEATFEGGTSAWMMSLLLDPLFMYWTVTGDRRVPEVVVKWCDFLDRRGMVPDGSKAYYVINCFAKSGEPGGEPGPDMEMHNPEMAYTFALGMYFTKDPARRTAYRRRFDQLFPLAVKLDVNKPPRAFSWVFQFTSQLVYFMQRAGR
ncbi:MAG: hypothetical protein LC795_14480 [Acidobacteria bacterium]|nr:hypothetical protein [Acidobacteriota bacterium]